MSHPYVMTSVLAVLHAHVASGVVHGVAQWAAGLPTFNPTTSGLPGGQLIQQLLDWGGGVALAAGLGAMIYGGGLWGWSMHTQNYGSMHKGKTFVMGGAIGALVLGVAPLAISTFFHAAQAGG